MCKFSQTRRFKDGDPVRFFTAPLKGTGRNIVLTPNFRPGKVIKYDPVARRYHIVTEENEKFDVHPRNIMPAKFLR